jgi:hypothetical protein
MEKTIEVLKDRISFCEMFIINENFSAALQDLLKGFYISHKIKSNNYSNDDIQFLKEVIFVYFSNILKECRISLEYIKVEGEIKKTEEYIRMVNDAQMEILLLQYLKV